MGLAKADPMGTAFTYQGRLIDSNQPADGFYDLKFVLYDDFMDIMGEINVDETQINDGYFTVELDFGNVFDGDNRWLEIGIRPGDQNDPCSYTFLNPRRKITPTPYAMYALQGLAADNADKVDGYHAGNSSGRVPVSNGTVCSNLNADLLDGLHASSFLGVNSDYGRSGVASDLYEGTTALTAKYVNKSGDTMGGRLYMYRPTATDEAILINSGSKSGIYVNITGSGSSLYPPVGIYSYAPGTAGIGVEAAGAAMDFCAAGSNVHYGTPSSIRWKHDIHVIDNPLNMLMTLNGVYFTWDAEHGGKHDVGMIAEEVGKVLPEIVAYEENGIDATGMDYSKLTPLLVEAVKALNTKVDQLRQQNTDKDTAIKKLEDTNRDLQERLTKVEKFITQVEIKPLGGK